MYDITQRRTIRKYSAKEVSDKLLHSLLQKAEQTQTMGNLQLYSVVVNRDNEMKRIPYMLIVGEKEVAEGKVSVRKQGGEDLGSMKYEDFAKKICEEVREMTKNF